MGWGVLEGEEVSFRSGDVTVNGYVGRPAQPGRFPGVIILHGIGGPGPGTRRLAERLGDEGYVGLLMNWQSRDQDPPDDELMRYVADAASFLRGLDYVDGGRIGVVGFCRGGGLVLLSLAHHPWLKAGVSFHGFPFYRELDARKPQHPYELAERIQSPVLMLHGGRDERSPVENVYRMGQRLEELGKTYALKVYSGAGHVFTLPDGRDYQPMAAADAWKEATTFLHWHMYS